MSMLLLLNDRHAKNAADGGKLVGLKGVEI